MQHAFADFLANRVFCILPSNDPLDYAGQRISARELGKWVKDNLVSVMGRRKDEPVFLDAGVPEMFEEAVGIPAPVRMHPPLPRSPSQQVIPLPQQLNAVSGALADLSSASPSPRWRHQRGLSNASSIGYSLSSVPQSVRPVSRKASFSVAPGEGAVGAPGLMASTSSTGPFAMVSRPTSAAGSRANTPLLRGRSMVASLGMSSSMSRAPSGSRELRTVLDQGIEEEEGESLGLSLGLEVNGTATTHVNGLYSHHQHYSHHHHHHHHSHSLLHGEEDQERTANMAEVEADNSRPPSRSESTHSAVRRRKRGARRGKGAQLQMQQHLIDMLEKTVVAQQQQLQSQQQQLDQVKQIVVLQSQVQGQQVSSPPASTSKPSFKVGEDNLESLADKSQKLARELSRTSRSASVSQLHQPGHGLSPSSSQHGSAAASSSSLAPAPPVLRRAISDLSNSAHPESEWEREASLNTSFTYTLPFGNGLPASVEVSHGPAVLPRSLSHVEAEAHLQSSTGLPPSFPVLRTPSGSLVSNNVPSFTSVLASSASSLSSPSKPKPSPVQTAVPVSAVAPPAPSPTATISPAIVKKPSKWKLSFGKSNSNTLSRSTLPSSSDEVIVIGSPDADGAEQQQLETGMLIPMINVTCGLTDHMNSINNFFRAFVKVGETEVEGAREWGSRSPAWVYTGSIAKQAPSSGRSKLGTIRVRIP